MSDKVFLLELLTKNNYYPNKIIIWADNEEKARLHSPVTGARVYNQSNPYGDIPRVENPFSYSDKSACNEMKPEIDYKIINSILDTIRIKLLGKNEEYTLIKNSAMDFNTGNYINFLTKIL